VLYENEAFHLIEGLEPRHFYEPFHQRLWEWIAERMASRGSARRAGSGSAQLFRARRRASCETGRDAWLLRPTWWTGRRRPPNVSDVDAQRGQRTWRCAATCCGLAVDLSHNAVEAVKVEDVVSLAEIRAAGHAGRQPQRIEPDQRPPWPRRVCWSG
jgi:hypothetical protein